MNKVKTILLSLSAIIGMCLSMLAYILISYDDQDYKQLLIKAVDNLTDYTLSIKGPFVLNFSGSPVLSASGIKLQSTTDSGYIHIDNFRLQLSVAPLLQNTLLINDLLLENVQAEIPTSKELTSSTDLFSHLPIPIIEHAVLKNLQLILGDDQQKYRLDSLLINENDQHEQLKLAATGRVNTRKFSIDGIVSLLSDANDSVKISSDYLIDLISGKHIKARYKGKISLGKTKISHDLLVSFNKAKPQISGEIRTVNLFPKDFGINSVVASKTSQQVANAKPGNQPLFSHELISLQVLHKVDLDLQLKIQRLKGEYSKLKQINMALRLKNGKLNVDPISFGLSGERVLITAEINARARPEWSLNIRGNTIKVADILTEQDSLLARTGKLSLVVQLKGTGASVHEIVSSLNGEVNIVLENERITRSGFEIVFLNPMGWIFSQGIFFADEIQISCGLAQYKIKQGIIKSKILLVDGPKVLIRGKEEINLGRETINSFYNLQKKNIFSNALLPEAFSSNVPIIVRGNLVAPTVEQAPIEEVESQVGRYIFAPVATIPREVIGTVLDLFDDKQEVHSPCSAFLGN